MVQHTNSIHSFINDTIHTNIRAYASARATVLLTSAIILFAVAWSDVHARYFVVAPVSSYSLSVFFTIDKTTFIFNLFIIR